MENKESENIGEIKYQSIIEDYDKIIIATEAVEMILLNQLSNLPVHLSMIALSRSYARLAAMFESDRSGAEILFKRSLDNMYDLFDKARKEQEKEQENKVNE